VYADRVRNQPRTVPPDMKRVFAPDGPRTLGRPIVSEQAAPEAADRFERRVELHEVDSLRHVNNANYVHYVEQAALDAAAAAGWSLETQVAAGGRFRVIAHDLEYLDAALYGDLLSLVTWPLEVSADRVERYTLLLRPGSRRPLVRAASTYEWVDAQTGTSQAMPAILTKALAPARYP